jgi:amino acid adenylation domain-containing protein
VTGLAARLAALPPEKRALFERRLQQAGGAAPVTGVPRLPRDGRPFPLSFAQERMWFHHQLYHGAPVYTESLGVEIRGRLDAALLGRGLDAVVRRHEALRTRFRSAGGELAQEVLPARSMLPTALPQVDLRALPPAARAAAERRIVGTMTGFRFDLAQAPLFRSLLVSTEDERALLLFVCHHIVFDGWSVAILFRELFLGYDALARRRAPDLISLPPLPLAYVDWSAWQRQGEGSATWAEQLAFWRSELAGVPPFLELPADLAPATAVSLQTPAGARHHFFFSLAMAEAVKALCQRENATPFMLLLAVFQTLLFRVTAEREIVVGSPATQRTRAELEGIVGLFVNTVALRAHLADARPFAALLAEVRERVLAAHAHRDLPFERLVQSLDLPRDAGRTPLAQVMFGYQKTPSQPFAALGLATRLLTTDNGTTKVELSLDFRETDHDLRGELEYSTQLFFPSSIARLAQGFQNLLAGVLADPERPLGELSLLAAGEAHQVLAEWSRGRPLGRRQGASVAVRIADQVARLGGQPAVRDVLGGERIVTYGELGRRAAGLAEALRAEGAGPDRVVGLLAERDADWVVGAVAILLSGSAYLPLDPDLPEERLRFLAADAGAVALLATPTAAPRLAGSGLPAVLLGRAVETLDGGRPAPVAVDPDNLAYVLYTSGTTGRPNGVMVTHGNLLTLLDGFDARVPVPAPLVGALVGPTSFDVSVWEVLTVLSLGGTLEICPLDLVAEPRRLARFLVSRGVTQAYLPPALLPEIVDELARQLPGPPGSVRLGRLLVGVAPIEQATLQRFLDVAPGLEIASAYGPTETAVAATLENFRGAREARRRSSVGGPIDGYESLLLDPGLRPVGVGWTGEICLGGRALSRGYRGRPELTAERYVPHPAPWRPGERLYRTGDLGRFLPDGNIEFLRRRDTQVKVRGFRVEPGEIETALAAAPGVREAVVVAREAGGLHELVAYVVATEISDSAAQVASWREHLRSRLPAYMVPSRFVVLPALPRTARGKLDRARLPDPTPENAPAAALAGEGAPRDELEATLVRLMAGALGASQVSVEDDFFDLGGYSLLASRLVQRIREELALELPLTTFFSTPTVAGVAAWVRAQRAAAGSRPSRPELPACLIPIQPRGERPPLFCVHPASGSPLCYLGLARELGIDQPVYGLQSPGLTDAAVPLETVPAMAALYVDALCQVQPRGPYFLAGWSFGCVVAFEMAAELARRGERVAFLGLFDAGVSDERRYPKRRRVRDALAALRGAIGNGFRLGLPRSYGELRVLASWIGLSLPESWAALRRSRGAGRRAFLAELSRGLAASQRIFKANFFAERAYLPTPIPGPVTLFRTRRIFTLHRGEDPMAEALSRFVRGELEVVPVPGNHMTLLGDQHVGALARELQRHIDPTSY